MSFSLFEAPEREPSRFVGFGGNVVDRQSENRADDATDRALADPAVRILLMRSGRVFLTLNGAGAFTAHYGPEAARALGARLDRAVLLGDGGHGPVVAAPSATEPEALPDDVKAIDLRSVYIQGLVAEATLGEIAQGAALLAWHANHRHCGRCGSPTAMRAGGYKRFCASCGTEHFPRTDPVAIMLAVTPGRCLLGRSPHFAPGMYSALAGFIEPGETIEAAVRRETFEEAGIRIGRVVYHASQPWPFPYSLMIGCFGEALGERIDHDAAELEDCRWFEREEVRTILEGRHPDGLAIPPPGAIATHLIRAWVDA